MEIHSKLPPNYGELCESKKWAERKEAMEALRKCLQFANDDLSNCSDSGQFISSLSTILAKDANINVQALAAECLGLLAEGMKQKFASHAVSVLPIALEKFKEKKPVLRDPLTKCVDSIAASMPSLEAAQEEIQTVLGKPNPQIKQQTMLFVSRSFNHTNPAKQSKKLVKALIPIFFKLAGDADADVREAAIAVLGSIQRLVGEKNLKTLLAELNPDDAKLKRISEASDVAKKAYDDFCSSQNDAADEEEDEVAPAATTSSKKPAGKPTKAAAAAPEEAPKEEDPWDFIDEYPILEKMPEGFFEMIESKKWAERRDVLQALNDSLRDHPRLDSKASYGELVGALKKIVEKDANIQVIALAANALRGLSDGLRAKFSPFTASVVPAIFEKFKEKKPVVKDPLVALIDSLSLHSNLETILEDVIAAFGKPNPNIKKETNLFIYRHMKILNSQTASKKAVKALVPLIMKTSGDPDAEVRDAASMALGSIMRIVGEKTSVALFDEIATDAAKMGKVKEYYQAILAEVGPAEVKKPAPAKAPEQKAAAKVPVKKSPPKQVEEPEEEEQVEEEPEEVEEKPKKPLATQKARKAAEEKKGEEGVLMENNEKQKRVKDEKSLKVLKWNFQTPTDEHIQQLQTQFNECAKMNLIQLLFQKDFKLHIKAVELILKAGEQNQNLLICNSDVLLKWCTLRFFETNPAALTKVLELARQIVELLLETSTNLPPEELNSFVPYLLLKTGEPKENVRGQVRDIVDLLTEMVGPVKIVPHLLESLKSKNSRQRAECLTIIQSYITNVGSAVFRVLTLEKLVALHVADKDMNVRSAAINVLVESFRYEGENMWKLAGKMADKEKSLVQERIKRLKVVPGLMETPVSSSTAKVVRGRGTTPSRTRQVESEDDEPLNRTISLQNRTMRKTNSEHFGESGRRTDRFVLDEDFIALGPSSVSNVALPAPLKRSLSSSSISSIDTSDQIQKSLQNISSAIPDVAKDAMYQVLYLMDSAEQKELLAKNMDLLLQASRAQLECIMAEKAKGNFMSDMVDAVSQMLFNATNAYSDCAEKLHVSIPVFKDLLETLLKIIMSFGHGNDQAGIFAARAFNRLTMKLIMILDQTIVLCSVIEGLSANIVQNTIYVDLFAKLLSKWEESMKAQPKRLYIPMVVATFDAFYQQALSAGGKDINDVIVTSVDNALEKVVMMQGRCLLEEARRLEKPTLHLTSLINKYLQMMAEQNYEPALPGSAPAPITKSQKHTPAMKKSQMATTEVEKLVEAFLEDTTTLPTFHTRLGLLISKTENMDEFIKILKTHKWGDFIQSFLENYHQFGYVPQSHQDFADLQFVSQSFLDTVKSSATAEKRTNHRPNFEELRLPQQTNRSRGLSNGSATITRKRISMTKEQLENIRRQVDQ